MNTINNTTATTSSLRDLLTARAGYSTYTATLGTNGNGGMLTDINDMLAADGEDQHLDGYRPAQFERAELEKHIGDAGGDPGDLDGENEWVAYDCRHEDKGYLTGGVSRIYVNLAV